MLWVHLLSGRGLKPAGRMQHLRDLYCVLECDHVHKARTVIRTGDLVFDWDETFELDLINNRELDFLIYSWDPQFRHKLCYKGSVSIAALLRESNVYQLALKVEPHGSLYVKLRYTEPKRCFERTPSPRKTALFGVDLETVVSRENSGLSVPLIVKRCVDEVERRGLDIIGLYRLCGSATKKRLLREAFEKSPRTVDLSPDNVPDINVITGQTPMIVHGNVYVSAVSSTFARGYHPGGYETYYYRYQGRSLCAIFEEVSADKTHVYTRDKK